MQDVKISDATIRLFVAIILPENAREYLLRVQGRMKRELSGFRWIAGENMHLTIRFIGETPASLKGSLVASLDKVCAAHKPFSLQIGEPGAFKTVIRPRVIWAGLQGNTTALHKLAADVRAATNNLGIDLRDKPFTPHITLARARPNASASGLPALLKKKMQDKPPEFVVDKAVLMQSRLMSGGAIHTALHSSALLAGA